MAARASWSGHAPGGGGVAVDLTPAQLKQFERDPEVEEFVRVLVRAELPRRAARLSITMEEDLLAAVDAAAGRARQSRSACLVDAVRAALLVERAV